MRNVLSGYPEDLKDNKLRKVFSEGDSTCFISREVTLDETKVRKMCKGLEGSSSETDKDGKAHLEVESPSQDAREANPQQGIGEVEDQPTQEESIY